MNKGARIRSVEAHPISYREPTDHNRFRSVCLVKITCEDGLAGWGECSTFFPEATLAAARIVEGMAEIAVGQSALENEAVWHRLKAHSWWYGTGAGIASFAVSGIDIALWDLKGKLLGASLLDLLGGPVRDELPAIASLHGTRPDIGDMAEEIAAHTATGLHGAKVGFGKHGDANLGFHHERDIEFAERVLDAMGPGKDLMIDLGVRNFWDVPTAIRRARAFEEVGVAWLEEPLGHDDPEGYAALRAATGIRIAYGEREWNDRGVKRIVDSGDSRRCRAGPRQGRGDHGLPQIRRDLRAVPQAGERAQFLDRGRRGCEPSAQLRLPRVPTARTPAGVRPRPRGPCRPTR